MTTTRCYRIAYPVFHQLQEIRNLKRQQAPIAADKDVRLTRGLGYMVASKCNALPLLFSLIVTPRSVL